MISKLVLGALLIGASVIHVPAVAAAPPDAGQSQSDPDQAERFFDHFYAKDYDAALKVADQLSLIADNPEGRGIVTAMRAAALLGLKRKAEAETLFAEAGRLAPQEPLIAGLQFEAALLSDDTALAGKTLDRMIARFPDYVRGLGQDTVYWVLREQQESDPSRNDDRRVALAQIGFGGEGRGDYLAQEAIGVLLDRRDLAGATDLLRYIDEPQLIEDMLIQRRYAALWPDLEKLAGPGLASVRASAVRNAERDYASAPDDNEKLQLLANALRHSGRHDQAIALRAKLPATPAAMAAADEELGWAVNNVALALSEVGRSEEADQLFASLNEAPMEAGRGRWRVSMIINRLELLVADGKFERALQLLDRTQASAVNDGSPYAQQLVRRLRYCTLAALGRKEEAARLLPEMLRHSKDARHATVDGLICAGELEKAEAVILAGLEEQEFQGQLVRSLQPRPLTSDDPSIWAGHWLKLRQRPRISAAFNRLGRDMPDAFVVPPPRPATAAKP